MLANIPLQADLCQQLQTSSVILSLQAVHVIDPTNMTVIKNITQDQNGRSLTNAAGAPITWNDVIYIQVRQYRYPDGSAQASLLELLA